MHSKYIFIYFFIDQITLHEDVPSEDVLMYYLVAFKISLLWIQSLYIHPITYIIQ